MKNKWIAFSIALVLMAGTAVFLQWLPAHRRLGDPGIIATPIPGQMAMKIEFPANVPGFVSTNMPESEQELGYFPKDTSFTRQLYRAGDTPHISATIVMMGADRTSIHKPDYCLPGQGWHIDEKSVTTIPLAGTDYQLPVSRWMISNSLPGPNGTHQTIHGIYVFWFVADGEQTPDFYQRLWWLTRDMALHGVLQRWAYVSYFAPCLPGQEDATYERVKRLISLSVPEFQRLPKTGSAIAPR
ncbi:MAG TPA: exosortase-associated EpsI family protein [Desulfuromonadaceae bacterium]|nr:exosortase-associated EpsI family protein [Desulfuromonadaceae bacterium]